MQAEKNEKSAAEDEELIDTLIAISIVAKRLAVKLRKNMTTTEGENRNENI